MPGVPIAVAVDVQHAWRPWPHVGDRGALFYRPDGLTVDEVSLASGYAAATVAELERAGAVVLRNRPPAGPLTGPYSRRGDYAGGGGARSYLACHVNAGRGGFARVSSIQPRAAGAPPNPPPAPAVSHNLF